MEQREEITVAGKVFDLGPRHRPLVEIAYPEGHTSRGFDHSLSWGLEQYRLITDHSLRSREWVETSMGHLIRELGDVPLLSVRRQEMRYFMNALRKRQRWENHPYAKPQFNADGTPQTLSESAVNNYARGVKAFYHKLAEEEVITENPLEGFKVRSAPKAIPPNLDQDQVKQLLTQPDLRHPEQVRNWVMICLLYDSGCRVSELCNMEMKNLSLKDHQFIVKGKDDRILPYRFAKNATRALIKYLAKRPKPAPGVDNVFLCWDGIPMNRGRVYKIIKNYGEKAGIAGVRVSPHTFRHANARMILRLGGNLKEVQMNLNHRDIKSTMIYAELEDKDAQIAKERYSPLDALGNLPGMVPKKKRRGELTLLASPLQLMRELNT